MKRHLAAIGAITAISAAGFTGASMVSAASTTDSSNPMSSLVDAMASKFNLDKTQVQAVFDEQKSAMQAEREAEMKTKIAQLVTDGEITQAQADKINTKRAELQKERETNREAMQSMTDAERKAEMESHKTEMDAWFSENDIDTEYRYLLIGVRGHGHGSPGGMRDGEMKTTDSLTTE